MVTKKPKMKRKRLEKKGRKKMKKLKMNLATRPDTTGRTQLKFATDAKSLGILKNGALKS